MMHVLDLIWFAIIVNVLTVAVGCVLATLPQLKGREDVVMTATSVVGAVSLILVYLVMARAGQAHLIITRHLTVSLVATMCVCSACAWLRRKKG